MAWSTRRKSLFICLIAVAFTQGKSEENKPGLCGNQDSSACPDNSKCISVESIFPGVTDTSQCTESPLCSGRDSGNCPTFSNWGADYSQIMAVCAFYEPQNCKKQPILDSPNSSAPNESTGANSSQGNSGMVDCYTVKVKIGSETVDKKGIYKCVHWENYKSDSSLYAQADAHLESCKSKDGKGICNGAGTCSSKNMEDITAYGCVCNAGYDAEDNCLTILSNKCNGQGQCNAGSCVNGECKCDGGFEGNQCTKCVKGENECKGGGECQADGTCKCKEGYKGKYCEQKSASGDLPDGGGNNGNTGGDDDGDGNAGSFLRPASTSLLTMTCICAIVTLF